MTIRPAAGAHRDGLAELLRLVDTFSQEEVDCALEVIDLALMPGNREYALLVAELGGALVGFVCYGPTPMTDRSFDLYWAATVPRARRQGVCTALVAAMEADLRGRRCRLIRVETSSLDAYAPARDIYRRLGYAEVARVPDFYRAGEDLSIRLKHM